MKTLLPTLEFERELWKKDFMVIGVDEVGRGALAGPVGVGAVCFYSQDLKTELEKIGVNDSKKLSLLQRQIVAEKMKPYIQASCVSYSSVTVINNKGIVPAVQIAIREAVKHVQQKNNTAIPCYLLLDAFNVKHIKGVGLENQKAIIKGDSLSISIAAAAILAKLGRDSLMKDLDTKHPQYNWKENVGYGTKVHRRAIQEYGPSKLHRKLFIRNCM